jgi:hypothetical protein
MSVGKEIVMHSPLKIQGAGMRAYPPSELGTRQTMRFHYGALPESEDFHPEADGWRNIREPGLVASQFMAILVGISIFFIWGACLVLFQKEAFSIQSSSIDINIGSLVLLLFIIPAHEFLHAIVHPGWGLSSKTIIGLWLSKGTFYVQYEGEMSRNRFLCVFITPFIILGVLPTVLIVTIPGLMHNLLWLSLFGSILACGDLLGAGLIFFQIPHSAKVRDKSWKTYWKM